MLFFSFLLKEYENRCYVTGVPDGENKIRTYGIDCVTELSIGKLSKVKKEDFLKQIDRFINVIG